MEYSGVFVFGDSLVDSGNALKLAKWYGNLTFSDLPDGAPTAADGYWLGRFSDGYTFADLLSNKIIGAVTKPVFPYGYEDPWLGIPVDPFAPDPSGNNLNFAYGGAQIRQGDEAVPDLDGQTDAFRGAVDGDADPNALYMVTIGGNDVRNLAPSNDDPVPQAEAYAALDKAADRMLEELAQLLDLGVQHILITGVPDVGLIPQYDRDGILGLNPTELARSEAATEYSQYLDFLIRTEVVPALEALGATVTYVPIMDYVDPAGNYITGALNANLPTIAALHNLTTEELSDNLLEYQHLLFFDDIHPNAQANALLGAYMHAQLTGSAWIETLPLTLADVDYRTTATISVAGEVDKLVVSLVAGTTYTFEMLGTSALGTPGTLGDPALRLLGPSGNLLAADDDSSVGFDATLTFTAATSGTYTLELDAVGSLTGLYALQAAVVGGAATLAGNTYTVSSAATLVIEGAGGVGVDIVKASVSYALAAGSEVEMLQTTNAKGKTAINLTGNDFDQKITGNSAANVLEGKGGADIYVGGAGNDTFVLGGSALTNPAAIDTISDYGAGDIVDITQVLSVTAGTNVTAGGYLRVTSTGLVQVDLDGGGDEWATLSNINGNSSVTVRYLSGGVATNVAVSRVSTTTSNSVMLSAVAAAGLAAVPAAAETTAISTEAMAVRGTDWLAAAVADTRIEGVEGPDRTALAGEMRVLDEPTHAAASSTQDGPRADAAGIAEARALPATPLSDLLPGTDTPRHDDSAARMLVADAVAMPSAQMLLAAQVAGDPQVNAEVGRVLADALAGGEAGARNLEALLDSLPGTAHGRGAALEALEALAGSGDHSFAGVFAAAHHAFALDVLALHEAVPPA